VDEMGPTTGLSAEWAAPSVRDKMMGEVAMSQMPPEVSKLLEQALALSLEEQEALADSLISNLGGKVDEGVQAAWEAEIARRIAELDSAEAKTAS
jgi:Putative addiction module component